MDNDLSTQDLLFILESLKYTKSKFEDYTNYPSYEYKQQRIEDVTKVMVNVQSILKNRKKKPLK